MRILDQFIRNPNKVRILRAELTPTTQRNLEALERHGYVFDTHAYKMDVVQRIHPQRSEHAVPRRLSPSTRTAHSFAVLGTSPKGEEAIYVRWETLSAAAGQTWLYIDGKRHRLLHILQELGEREPRGG